MWKVKHCSHPSMSTLIDARISQYVYSVQPRVIFAACQRSRGKVILLCMASPPPKVEPPPQRQTPWKEHGTTGSDIIPPWYWQLEDICAFCGATDKPVLDFQWRLLWVSKPQWAALFTLGRGIPVTFSLRFTSGATPADPELFLVPNYAFLKR